tara:strand:- start:164 stop:472 length:309 start_codon:yes stop_codon:yes gene_type:complete
MAGCKAGDVGGTGFCIKHGGGTRCSVQGCTSCEQRGTGRCIKHGGGTRCKIENCTSGDVGGCGRCKKHGGKRLKLIIRPPDDEQRETNYELTSKEILPHVKA